MQINSKLTCLIMFSIFALSVFAVDFEQMPIKVILFPFRKAVISATVDGVVEKHSFREGKSFRKGDLLVSIVAVEYREKLAKAKATCEELKKNRDFLEQLYKGNQKLREKGMFSRMELKKNKTDLDIATARLKAAEAEKKLAERKVDACRITAPFKGRIEEILIQEYEFVRNSEKIISIIDDNRLLAIMHLPEKYNSIIRIGQQLSLKIPSSNKVYNGKVFEKAARINHRSRTFQVKLVLDNSNGELTAGMSGVLISRPEGKVNNHKNEKNGVKLAD